MSKLPLANMQGERLGEVEVADDLLVLNRGAQAVHEAVTAQRAAARAGTASTKTKGTAAGSGKKPWRQKGTGRARAGYRRSPLWRGGGVAFGPKPRDYAKAVPKKMARLAFRRAFSEKVAAGEVTILDQLAVPEPKTRIVAGLLKKLGAADGALLVVDAVDANLARASRNLAALSVCEARNVSTYDLLRHARVLITKPGLGEMEKRLRAPVRRGE